MSNELYIPKGGMCMVCRYSLEDCSSKPFSQMPLIKEEETFYETLKIVRCVFFDRVGDE